MKRDKFLSLANVSLFLIAIILAFNLLGYNLPNLGKSVQQLKENSLCIMKTWDGDYVTRNIDACCLEKRKLVLNCNHDKLYYTNLTLNWKCLTRTKIEYYFNEYGYHYCEEFLNQ